MTNGAKWSMDVDYLKKNMAWIMHTVNVTITQIMLNIFFLKRMDEKMN